MPYKKIELTDIEDKNAITGPLRTDIADIFDEKKSTLNDMKSIQFWHSTEADLKTPKASFNNVLQDTTDQKTILTNLTGMRNQLASVGWLGASVSSYPDDKLLEKMSRHIFARTQYHKLLAEAKTKSPALHALLSTPNVKSTLIAQWDNVDGPNKPPLNLDALINNLSTAKDQKEVSQAFNKTPGFQFQILGNAMEFGEQLFAATAGTVPADLLAEARLNKFLTDPKITAAVPFLATLFAAPAPGGPVNTLRNALINHLKTPANPDPNPDNIIAALKGNSTPVDILSNPANFGVNLGGVAGTVATNRNRLRGEARVHEFLEDPRVKAIPTLGRLFQNAALRDRLRDHLGEEGHASPDIDTLYARFKADGCPDISSAIFGSHGVFGVRLSDGLPAGVPGLPADVLLNAQVGGGDTTLNKEKLRGEVRLAAFLADPELKAIPALEALFKKPAVLGALQTYLQTAVNPLPDISQLRTDLTAAITPAAVVGVINTALRGTAIPATVIDDKNTKKLLSQTRYAELLAETAGMAELQIILKDTAVEKALLKHFKTNALPAGALNAALSTIDFNDPNAPLLTCQAIYDFFGKPAGLLAALTVQLPDTNPARTETVIKQAGRSAIAADDAKLTTHQTELVRDLSTFSGTLSGASGNYTLAGLNTLEGNLNTQSLKLKSFEEFTDPLKKLQAAVTDLKTAPTDAKKQGVYDTALSEFQSVVGSSKRRAEELQKRDTSKRYVDAATLYRSEAQQLIGLHPPDFKDKKTEIQKSCQKMQNTIDLSIGQLVAEKQALEAKLNIETTNLAASRAKSGTRYLEDLPAVHLYRIRDLKKEIDKLDTKIDALKSTRNSLESTIQSLEKPLDTTKVISYSDQSHIFVPPTNRAETKAIEKDIRTLIKTGSLTGPAAGGASLAAGGVGATGTKTSKTFDTALRSNCTEISKPKDDGPTIRVVSLQGNQDGSYKSKFFHEPDAIDRMSREERAMVAAREVENYYVGLKGDKTQQFQILKGTHPKMAEAISTYCAIMRNGANYPEPSSEVTWEKRSVLSNYTSDFKKALKNNNLFAGGVKAHTQEEKEKLQTITATKK